MSNFSYENQGVHTYLVYDLEEKEEIDTLSLGMITNNKIPGLAAAIYTQLDTKKYIKYNISSKVPASQIFSKKVSKRLLLGVFCGVADALLSSEEYMIDSRMIVMDLNYVFADISTCDTVLICLPVINNEQATVDPGTFFKNIMFSTQFDQRENCDYVAKIMNYLNSASLFSLADFRQLLEGISKESSPLKNTGKPVSAPNSSVSSTKVESINPIPPVMQTGSGVNDLPVSKKKVEDNRSINIPGQPFSVPQHETEEAAESAVEDGDSISLFYLLQHYNKENAAKYKAQKAKRKQQKSSKEKKNKKEGKKISAEVKGTTDHNNGMDLPVSPGYAVPGMDNPELAEERNDGPVSYVQSSGTAVQPHVNQGVRPVQSLQSEMPGGAVNVVNNSNVEADFGETSYYIDESDTGTIIMGQENLAYQINPHLICKKNNEKIPINKEIFRLGRDMDFNDYAIVGNQYVGHSHCHIIVRDDKYFIVDDNSKNHTWVDGVLAPSGTEVRISHGQSIRLANEEFEFRLF